MKDKRTWLEKHGRSCKIGTVPSVVRVHGGDVLAPGRYVRIQECENDKWHDVLVTAVHEDGYFKANR